MDVIEVLNHFVTQRPDRSRFKYWVDTNFSWAWDMTKGTWCDTNVIWYYGYSPMGEGYRYWFEKEEDKVMFVLKWM